MGAFKAEQFGGCLPAWDPHLLPAGQAADSLNSYLFSGALIGWRVPKLLRSLLSSTAKKVYRVPVITKASALAYMVFLSNPVIDDKITLGEEVYRFTTNLKFPYDVMIGANPTESADNLFKAFTASGTNDVTYATGTVANPAISTDDSSRSTQTISGTDYQVIAAVASSFGTAYNATVVSESTSGVRYVWLYDLLSLTDTTTTLLGGINETFDNQITGAATWLEFQDPFTDVMRSPVVDDQYDRYYFASPSLPPMYNTYDRIQAGSDPWLLGVPAPGCNPGVTVAGGGSFAAVGDTTSTTNNYTAILGNHIILVPVTPTGAVQLDSVEAVTASDSTTVRFTAVVYADNGGVPGELLNVAVESFGSTVGGTIQSTFTNPIGLLANLQYWVGFAIAAEDTSVMNANDTGTTGVSFSATYSNGPPEFAPTVTQGLPSWLMWAVVETDAILEARAYTYTWVSAYDEEGPPAPPTLVNGWSNASWTVGLFTPSQDEMGVTRNITKTRIYRTIPDTGGGASYYFVAELDVTTPSYVDVAPDSDVALNIVLPSAFWSAPPLNLQGMLSMPNGMAVGFTGNELWFCEPYRPHAWPANYVLTTEFPIVGIGVNGNSVIAATSGTPYIATGVSPGSMTLTKAISPEPCISRGSVLATDLGVFYASPNGLIMVSPSNGMAQNITETWVTRDKWQALVPQQNLTAIQLSSTYFAFQVGAQTGFMLELNNDADSFTIWPQPGGHRIGFNRLSAPLGTNVDNIQIDPWTGIGIMIANGNVYYYDFSDQAPVIQPCIWRSKIMQQTAKNNFEAMKIYFSVPPGTPAQNAARNQAPTDDASWDSLQDGQYGIVRVFADGELVTVREIVKSGELMRILSGFKAEEWQFEIETRVLISNLQVATSAKELASV